MEEKAIGRDEIHNESAHVGVPLAAGHNAFIAAFPPGQSEETGLQSQTRLRDLPRARQKGRPEDSRGQGHLLRQARQRRSQRDQAAQEPQGRRRGASRPQSGRLESVEQLLGGLRWHTQIL